MVSEERLEREEQKRKKTFFQSRLRSWKVRFFKKLLLGRLSESRCLTIKKILSRKKLTCICGRLNLKHPLIPHNENLAWIFIRLSNMAAQLLIFFQVCFSIIARPSGLALGTEKFLFFFPHRLFFSRKMCSSPFRANVLIY